MEWSSDEGQLAGGVDGIPPQCNLSSPPHPPFYALSAFGFERTSDHDVRKS
jgi:hypothetical protein